MSAFLVDDTTMHRALMGAHFASRRNGWDPDEMTKLGRKWFAMNIAALRARYGSRAFEPDAPEPNLHETYEFRPVDNTRADCFKAMQCLRYQCTEGEIPATPEYEELSDLAYNLASAIIADLPEYKRAEW